MLGHHRDNDNDNDNDSDNDNDNAGTASKTWQFQSLTVRKIWLQPGLLQAL